MAVNNAGTEGAPGPVTEQTAESYAATFDTNVLGTLLSMKHELRAMLRRHRYAHALYRHGEKRSGAHITRASQTSGTEGDGHGERLRDHGPSQVRPSPCSDRI
jgi:NAD(P)-dependent dehydrogenase (short-subunit alcohol dehydrogenase family)